MVRWSHGVVIFKWNTGGARAKTRAIGGWLSGLKQSFWVNRVFLEPPRSSGIVFIPNKNKKYKSDSNMFFNIFARFHVLHRNQSGPFRDSQIPGATEIPKGTRLGTRNMWFWLSRKLSVVRPFENVWFTSHARQYLFIGRGLWRTYLPITLWRAISRNNDLRKWLENVVKKT